MQLVDTNILSELMRAQPDAGVLAWLQRQELVSPRLTISVVTVDEIMDGLGLGEVLGEAFKSKTLPSRESFWKKLRRWVGFNDDFG